MKQNSKYQKEINKATKHLMKYAEKEKWAQLKLEYFDDMWATVANGLDKNDEEIIHCLMEGEHLQSAVVFLLENMFNLYWEGEPMSLIEEYLKQRGWRETALGRQYLRAFNKSFVGLYEVVDIKKDEYIVVREIAHENTQRIYDKSISQNISKWSWLAARVITLNRRKIFTGSSLALSSEDIDSIFEEVDIMRACIFEELKVKNKTAPSSLKKTKSEIEEMADMQASVQIQDMIFKVWASKIYLVLTQDAPVVHNRDAELFKHVNVVFSIASKDRKKIINLLNGADFLDSVGKNKKWAWLGCHKNEIPEFGTTLLGEVILTNKSIKLSVNSDNRAIKGQEYLQDILNDLIGKPLTTEKSMQEFLSENKPAKNQPTPNLLENSDEAKEIISKVLAEHYRKTLDEKIPVLDNKTPRQCAQDKNMKPKLIQWLKSLESSGVTNPQMQDFDFRWMWEELGISYPK